MTGAAGAGPPTVAPDGARLVDLPMRRAWLGRPEIAQAAPRVGALLLSTDGAPLVRWSASDGSIETLRAGGWEACGIGDAELTTAWVAAWLEAGLEAGDTARAPAALLFDRGMLGAADESGPLVRALRCCDPTR